MRKCYLSRAESRVWGRDNPIGDPTGGPAYGEKTDLGTIAAGVGIASGVNSLLGGGSSGGSTTSTGTSSVPQYLQDAGLNLVNMSQTNANRAYQANPYLRQAAFTPQQLQAQQMVQQLAAAGNPAQAAANQNLSATLNGNYLSPDSNPYLQQNVGRALDDVSGRVNSQFALGGAYGGSANQELLSRTLGDTAAQMYGQNYQEERQRQMQAASLSPAMAQADYLGANALNTLGGQVQQFNQNDINNQSQAWQNEWNYPLQQQDTLASGIAGAMGTATKTATQQNPYFTNPMANALGLATSGMQLYGMGQNLGWWGGNTFNSNPAGAYDGSWTSSGPFDSSTYAGQIWD